MSYGIYQHGNRNFIKEHVVVTPETFDYENMLAYFKSDVAVLQNDFPKYDNITTIDLENNKLYKVSHGSFKSNNKLHVVELLKENNWIVLHENTGKDQSRYFKEELHVGDYVYITLGSKELIGIARIASEEWEYVPNEITDEEGWMFREIEFIKAPLRKSPKDLNDKRTIFPSGNSTLTEIKSELVEEANEKLFKPYFNVEFTLSDGIHIKAKFMDWLVENISGGNYFVNQFSSKRELLEKELDEYETIYKDTFSKDLFIINNKNLTTQIEAIKNNIYDSSAAFYDYSKNHYSGRPTAILGNKNYLRFLKENFSTPSDMDQSNESKPQTFSLNQILYGPPGTGKTYTLKTEYFPKYTLNETSITKEQFFEETVRNLTWWQVIALGLLEKGTSRVNDILTNRWVALKASLSESKNVRATLWGTLQMHTVQESKTVAYTQRQAPLIFDKKVDKSWKLLENELKEQTPELYDILDSVNNFKANPNKEIKHYVFTTFHQSFSYEDFIEGIKPVMEDGQETPELKYKIEPGIFKELCSRAQSDPNNRYAIFIDEINRGNVSQVFGELITLIETDKRLGAVNEMKVKLPYSKKEFGVPSNVDIYGTMNTADRSVEALDTALRRRFIFKELMPDSKVIEKKDFSDYSRVEIMTKINNRIELLLDRNHTLGHAYFIKDGFKQSFENEIIPLLQEYFYNDYGKIGLVLGKGFVQEKSISVGKDKNIFADFETKNEVDILKCYEMIPFSEVDFDSAIAQLLL